MSLDLNPIVTEVADLKAKIEAMTNASATADKIAELENTIKAQEVLIQDAKNTIEALNSEKEEAAKKSNEYMIKKEEEFKKVSSDLNEALEALAGYKTKMEEMAKTEKKNKRMASLVDAGLDSETVASTVEKFESMDDDTFDALTVLLAAKKSKIMEEKKVASEEVETDVKPEATVDASVLDNAEVQEEVNLGVASDVETEVNSTRAALVDFVRNRLGKTINKGE